MPSVTARGLCTCGCGTRTPIATRTRRDLGHVRGQPIQFVHGHNRRKSGVEYIVDAATGCWLWQRALTTDGYSRVFDGTRMVPAHRVYYERVHGPLPPGMQIDHLCHITQCVNPEHLRAVTPDENQERRRSKLTRADAEAIRASTASDDALGRRFGVAYQTIRRIRSGRERVWREPA